MTPEEIIAKAQASGSPALEALVMGHIAAGRPGMAWLALGLDAETLAALDAYFTEARSTAALLGIAVAAYDSL